MLEDSTNLLNVEESISKDGTEGEEDLEDLEVDRRTDNLPTWHYDGNEYPYHAVEMRGGTPCDLKNNEPRFTRLLFICLEDVVAEVGCYCVCACVRACVCEGGRGGKLENSPPFVYHH